VKITITIDTARLGVDQPLRARAVADALIRDLQMLGNCSEAEATHILNIGLRIPAADGGYCGLIKGKGDL
jgi:hypothetical protein